MDKELREQIIKVFYKHYGCQMVKKDLIDCLSHNYTAKEINTEYSLMKKDGLVYSVTDLKGWVGYYIK